MKFYKNWYFPQTENKFIEYLKNLDTDEYQKNQRDASIKLIDNSRTAIDIGANIGFWARDLCKIFKNVVLFEPHKLNIECLKKNLENYSNFTTYEYALSNFKGIGDTFLILSWLIPIYALGSISGYLLLSKGIDLFYEVFFISIFISFLQRPPSAHTRLPSRKEVQLFVNTFISIFLIYMLMDTFAPQFVNNVRMGLAVAIGTQLAGGIKLKKD